MTVKHLTQDQMYDSEEVACEAWRWGHTSTRVYTEPNPPELKGTDRYWMFTVQVHSQDGWQDCDGGIDTYEVRPVVVKTTEWREV